MDENYENPLITDFDQLFAVLQDEDNQNSFIKSVPDIPVYPEYSNFPKILHSNNNSINRYDGQQEMQIAKIDGSLDENEVKLALKTLESADTVILDNPISNANVKIVQQLIYKPKTKEIPQLLTAPLSLQLEDLLTVNEKDVQDLIILQGSFESSEAKISSEIPKIIAETSQSSYENCSNSLFSTANNESTKTNNNAEVIELGATSASPNVVHPATSSFYVLEEKGKSSKAFKIPDGLLIFSKVSLPTPPLAALRKMHIAESVPQCTLCKKTYVSKASLKRHICLVCPCCKIRFSRNTKENDNKTTAIKSKGTMCARCSILINSITNRKILSENNNDNNNNNATVKIVRKYDYNNAENRKTQHQDNENNMRKRFKPNNNNNNNKEEKKPALLLSASTINSGKKTVKFNIVIPPPIPNKLNVIIKKRINAVPMKVIPQI